MADAAVESEAVAVAGVGAAGAARLDGLGTYGERAGAAGGAASSGVRALAADRGEVDGQRYVRAGRGRAIDI